MSISQKCQYALRALLSLGRLNGQATMTVGEIAEEQGIPARFLENILVQLRQGGFVGSRRGREGGYRLAREARSLSVGEVIRFIDGPLRPVECLGGAVAREACALRGDCVFLPLWQRAQAATAEVYDKTFFSDLVADEEKRRARGGAGAPYPVFSL